MTRRSLELQIDGEKVGYLSEDFIPKEGKAINLPGLLTEYNGQLNLPGIPPNEDETQWYNVVKVEPNYRQLKQGHPNKQYIPDRFIIHLKPVGNKD